MANCRGDHDEATAGATVAGSRSEWAGGWCIRLRFGQNPVNPWSTVVGVVKNIKSRRARCGWSAHIMLPLNQICRSGR